MSLSQRRRKEEEVMKKRDYVLDEEPIMELEPEMREEPFPNQEITPDAAIMEEGPALDIMGQQMSPLETYFPNEEARMGIDPEPEKQDSLTVERSDNLMMLQPESEFVSVEELPLFKEPAMEDSPVLDGGVKREKRDLMTQGGGHCCPGVELERKRYQFFKGPLRAEDAEFFCQAQFPGGHLASITSHRIHREVMNMMLRQNGAYTRTWIGGLRYLETGRFIWLDGSPWGYADWLSGEPNNTVNKENCVELLALGNGKFNDFTCWEPQAFICSYPYQ
ncbi:low affinity immunoglobulin epsilon Fc receptor [Lates calcarifer]|uniref:low affinity immunoglobulin epsilon Fc receptor n=1 Tax=Lates calcarifer TaxID=8187 RepID=UPI00087377F1|nr:low affinity immunoglobulin epsilon Fc receptor [Lates calcarifer]